MLTEHGVKISLSTYYEWVARQPTRRQVADAELIEVIRSMREDKKTGKFVQTLGARKLWLRLRGKGHDVARCTVERIMREQGWEGARYGSKHTTTIAEPGNDRRPDLVDRNFWAPSPSTNSKVTRFRDRLRSRRRPGLQRSPADTNHGYVSPCGLDVGRWKLSCNAVRCQPNLGQTWNSATVTLGDL